MNLKDALAAIAPVVGDGRLIPQHAYVLVKDGYLHATDGRQWIEVSVDDCPANCCVRYDALRKALDRDHTAILTDSDNGWIVRYGRGRARLRGIDPNTFPRAEPPDTERSVGLPDDFNKRIKDLLAFCADGDGHVWQQAIHMTSTIMLAANSFALAKYPCSDLGTQIGIPAWACKFIANMATAPVQFRDRGQMVSFYWYDVELFTTLLTQEVPPNIIGFARAIAEPTTPVPEGLKESVERIAGHGGKTCRIGGGGVSYTAEAVELSDELDIAGETKTWGTDTLLAALEHATTLDLSGTNATWAGGGYVGVFGEGAD